MLLVSEDLDELLELSDRVVVMFDGRIVHETPIATADIEVIGPRMAGHAPTGLTRPMPEIAARPYAYAFEVPTTALVVIDMQRDFIERGGFGEALGNDVSRLAAIVPTVAALIEWCRRVGSPSSTRGRGTAPDLSDCPPAKLYRGTPACNRRTGPMGRILVDGEPGNDIVPAWRRGRTSRSCVKPGEGKLYATPLDA